MKVKGKDCYDINTIDNKTKFVVEENFMKIRSKTKINQHFKNIKNKVYSQVLERYKKEKIKPKKRRKLFAFYSDKFWNYKTGATKYFGRISKIVAGVPIACKKYGLKYNNNAIERYNEDIKDRYKITRGWKVFDSASKTLRMRQIIHNFVNPHMQLKGKTPAEVADIKLKLGNNKLLDLIANLLNNGTFLAYFLYH